MKKIMFFAATLFVVAACTVDKTAYESETNSTGSNDPVFEEVFSYVQGPYLVRVDALDGQLYQGYNEMRVHVAEASTKQTLTAAAVHFLPVLTTNEGTKESCPNTHQLTYQPEGKYFKGYSVFTKESTAGQWAIFLSLEIKGQRFDQEQPIEVQHQKNMNLQMTSFVGKDQEDYIIALVAPIQPKVAENQLIAGIYRANRGLNRPIEDPMELKEAYVAVENYKLLLDPRMPEPSMGNHSSPNNRDLMQEEDGFYHGVVNYTMTGNWTLNFILQNHQGRILKGTKVPTDFTPGVQGVKSELFIDTLF